MHLQTRLYPTTFRYHNKKIGIAEKAKDCSLRKVLKAAYKLCFEKVFGFGFFVGGGHGNMSYGTSNRVKTKLGENMKMFFNLEHHGKNSP